MNNAKHPIPRSLLFLLFFFLLFDYLPAQSGGNDCPSAVEICSFPVTSTNAGASANAPFSSVYSIDILDASGCTATLEAIIAQPTEVTVHIDDPFQGGQQIVGLGGPLILRLITTPPFVELDTVIWTTSAGRYLVETVRRTLSF